MLVVALSYWHYLQRFCRKVLKNAGSSTETETLSVDRIFAGKALKALAVQKFRPDMSFELVLRRMKV